MWVRGKLQAPAVLLPGKTPYSMYRRLSGPQDPLWKGAEILANTGIQSPNLVTLSHSIYRRRYPGSQLSRVIQIVMIVVVIINPRPR
jgi:hypothetical protein